MEIRADYSDILLLPPSIEDWIPYDHPARFIRDFVDSLDLSSLGFHIREAEEGRPNYSSDLLLKVWLYGYVMRIRSNRRLEQACLDQLPFIWLTGNHAPDHNTLWRFFRSHHPVMKRLFRNVVQVAAAADLVGMVLQAVDGTKLKSRSSNRTGWHRKSLEKALASLDASIDEALSAIDRAGELGEPSYRLPEKLQNAEVRRATIRAQLAILNAEERNHKHPLEPEARMQQAGPERAFGYNAQAVVDAKHGLVVAETVVVDENDVHQLVPMLDEVVAMLGRTAIDTVADKGYAASEEFAKLESRGFEATVALPKTRDGESKNPYEASKFTYNAEEDVIVCPRDVKLPLLQIKKEKEGYDVRVYQCQVAALCPVRWQCSKNKYGRLVSLNPYHVAVEKQRAKYRDTKQRELLEKRKELIELVFAHIKEHEIFRRWTVRGLKKVRAQWSFTMTVYNLKKLYRLWKEKLFPMPVRSAKGSAPRRRRSTVPARDAWNWATG